MCVSAKRFTRILADRQIYTRCKNRNAELAFSSSKAERDFFAIRSIILASWHDADFKTGCRISFDNYFEMNRYMMICI